MASATVTVACIGPFPALDILSCALVQGVNLDARVLGGLRELQRMPADTAGPGWLQVNRLGEMAPAVVAQACVRARRLGWPVVFLTRGPQPSADEAMLVRDLRPDETLPSRDELQMIRRRMTACELTAA